ncbi:hypothetical protein [Mycobacterium sp.]|uniref:hypothetical protein n=1 Tax=Mycobacterium sp. TaxID=1785 RepID=UPI003F9B01CF
MQSVAAFNAPGPVPFDINDANNPDWVNSLCPCGSGKRVGDCHSNRSTKRWLLPRHAPLLSDPVTGHARQGCYAASTCDCAGKLTKEHWISEGILRSPTFGDGRKVDIGELFWQRETSQVLPIAALGARVLCERHNNALSRLDSTATRLHATVERYYLAQLREPDRYVSEFDLISGEDIERWLLKLVWGRLAAAKETPTLLEDTRTRKVLLQYLFRDGKLPRGWGLYIRGRRTQVSQGDFTHTG